MGLVKMKLSQVCTGGGTTALQWLEEKNKEGNAGSMREIRSQDGQADELEEKSSRETYAPLAQKEERLEPGSAK